MGGGSSVPEHRSNLSNASARTAVHRRYSRPAPPTEAPAAAARVGWANPDNHTTAFSNFVRDLLAPNLDTNSAGFTYSADGENVEMCAVCLADLKQDGVALATGTCGHSFHALCLHNWICHCRSTCTEETCPLDRKPWNFASVPSAPASAYATPPPSGVHSGGGPWTAPTWTCPSCAYINQRGNPCCSMCSSEAGGPQRTWQDIFRERGFRTEAQRAHRTQPPPPGSPPRPARASLNGNNGTGNGNGVAGVTWATANFQLWQAERRQQLRASQRESAALLSSSSLPLSSRGPFLPRRHGAPHPNVSGSYLRRANGIHVGRMSTRGGLRMGFRHANRVMSAASLRARGRTVPVSAVQWPQRRQQSNSESVEESIEEGVEEADEALEAIPAIGDVTASEHQRQLPLALAATVPDLSR